MFTGLMLTAGLVVIGYALAHLHPMHYMQCLTLLVVAGVASLVITASYRISWPIPLLVLPAMYGVYRSYRLYFGQAATFTCTVALAKAAGTTR